jgi:hypothetical protein
VRTNYVLIDFESVQPESLRELNHDHFKVLVFVGANQSKLRFEVTASLQQLGTRAEYIKLSGHGPNALDFHIAYYIGRLAAVDPSAYFHIISKDTGFDPLIQHLLSKKIFARRANTVGDIPFVKMEVIQARLQQLKAAKPRTVKALSSTIASLFQNQLTETEIAALVQGLANQGGIQVTGTKVTYAPSNDSKQIVRR